MHCAGIGRQMGSDLRFGTHAHPSVLQSFFSLLNSSEFNLVLLVNDWLQDMVVIPYKDSLLLFSRYLQQLVMESLGKEFDLDGNKVHIHIFIFLTYRLYSILL